MANRPYTTAEKSALILLWTRGHTAAQIASELSRQPKSVSIWLRRFEQQGLVTTRAPLRMINPLGHPRKKRLRWSKLRKFCPHGHYMSRKNSIKVPGRGTFKCRKCYNAYLQQYTAQRRKGIRTSVPKPSHTTATSVRL